MSNGPVPSRDAVLQCGDSIVRSRDDDARRYWSENRHRIATAVTHALKLAHAATTQGALEGAAPSAPGSTGSTALTEQRPPPLRVLDVGPALESELLGVFLPAAELETMGWADHRYQPANLQRHHPFDLNDSIDPQRCPRTEPFDLILLLEVIEHLHTAPSHVFKYLRSCLRPGGHLLVSTPNAAWLRNRWRLLFGRNPFEPIREDPRNPGHFRELTPQELQTLLDRAGFKIVSFQIDSLYAFSSKSGRRFSRIAQLLPQTFRHDMLCIATRRE